MVECADCKETFDCKIEFDEENRKIVNEYLFLETLGQGSFSKVKLARNIKTNKEFAIKILNKKVLEKKNKSFTKDADGNIIISSSLQNALREMAILKKLSHRNVVKLFEIIHNVDRGKIYLVSELANKGPVMKYDEFSGEFSLNEKLTVGEHTYYTEDQIRTLFRDIVSGLDYLHANGIVHRDIKPDNVLVNFEGICKITDFNVSTMLEKNQTDELSKTEGTIYFYAPEMCQKENPNQKFAGKPLDIWALGVTLFVMTFNKLPIRGQDDGDLMELLDLVSEAKIVFPDEETRPISNELKELILKLLEKDPNKRVSTKEIKTDPWINLGLPDLSKEEYKVVEVSEEEIKDSLKFFYTLMKTKQIAKEFKTKLKTLSMKRKSMINKKESIELQEPRFIENAKQAKEKQMIEEIRSVPKDPSLSKQNTIENLEKQEDYENSKCNTIEGNEEKAYTQESIKETQLIEKEQKEPTQEIKIREEIFQQKDEGNSVKVTDEIKDASGGEMILNINDKEKEIPISIPEKKDISKEENKNVEDIIKENKKVDNNHILETKENSVKAETELREKTEEKEGNTQEIVSPFIDIDSSVQKEEIDSTHKQNAPETNPEIAIINSKKGEEHKNEESFKTIHTTQTTKKETSQETKEFIANLNEHEKKKEDDSKPPLTVTERKCCIIF